MLAIGAGAGTGAGTVTGTGAGTVTGTGAGTGKIRSSEMSAANHAPTGRWLDP